MKKYIHKGISLTLVMTMITWCLVGCGSAENTTNKTSKVNTTKDTATMESLLTSKIGSAGSTDKNETVYIEMKADGNVKNTTVSDVLKVSGNDNISDVSNLKDITNLSGQEKYATDSDGRIVWENKGKDIKYQGTTTESVPVKVDITYYLDDEKIAPKDLAGKSGKVKIVYNYENTAKDADGNFVPFVVLTGMVLDNDVFSNVEVNNGKAIDYDGSKIVMGYAAPGLKDHLLSTIKNASDYIGDIDIPEEVTVTADVKDFSMEMTITVASSELGDMDLKKSLDFSDLESQMNELQDGADQLVKGTSDLNNGASTLKSGTSKLSDGANTLSNGTKQLSSGTGELENKYTIFNKALLDGVGSAKSGANKLYAGTKEVESAATAINNGSKELESAASAINDGSKELESAASAVAPGTEELESAASAVSAGVKQIAGGISQVKDGMEDETASDGTLKSQGAVNGSEALKDGAASANKGVQSLAGTLQKTPDSIQKQIDDVIAKIKSATNGAISSETALNSTVEAINNAVKSGADLQKVLVGNSLDVNTYYSLLQAYYSVQTLESVKSTFESQIKASANEIKQLLSGMNSLEDGTASLNTGINKMYKGIKELDGGAKAAANGAGAVATGLKTLKTGTTGLKNGTAKMSTATSSLKKGTKNLASGTGELKKGAAALNIGMKQLYVGANTLSTKLNDASPQIKTGITKIDAATKQVSDGAGTLSSGAESLDDGVVTLFDGTKELNSGAIKLNDQGISKITSIFGEDSKEAVDKIQDLLNTGKEYKSFSGINDDMSGSVKFIYKTDEIKADK